MHSNNFNPHYESRVFVGSVYCDCPGHVVTLSQSRPKPASVARCGRVHSIVHSARWSPRELKWLELVPLGWTLPRNCHQGWNLGQLCLNITPCLAACLESSNSGFDHFYMDVNVFPVCFHWFSNGLPVVFQCNPIMQFTTGLPLGHCWVIASVGVVPVVCQCTCSSSGLLMFQLCKWALGCHWRTIGLLHEPVWFQYSRPISIPVHQCFSSVFQLCESTLDYQY